MKPFNCVQKDEFKKCYQQNEFTNHIYLTGKYKEDLALNNLQGLICHKKLTNQLNQNYMVSNMPLAVYVLPIFALT